MGMVGLIFEPHPPSSANQCNFWRCANDVTMTFWYLYQFQIYKKVLWVWNPGNWVILALGHKGANKNIYKPIKAEIKIF